MKPPFKFNNIIFFLFFLFRIVLFIGIFKLTPNTVDQYNISYNFGQGNGLNLMIFDNCLSPKLINYYEHPKLFSVVLGMFVSVTKQMFLSIFLLFIFLIVWEYLLITNILKIIEISAEYRLLFLLFISFYLGHLDRGTITDYFSMLFVISFVVFVYFIHLKSKLKIIDLFIYTCAVILLPTAKYNILAVLFVAPIMEFIGTRRDRNKRLCILMFPIFVSLVIFYFTTYQFVKVTKEANGLFIDSNLLRVDYFWFHYGYELDRFFKHVAWKSKYLFNSNIKFWNIAQIMSIIFYVAVLSIKPLNILDKLRGRIFYQFILSLIFVHVSFMIFLSVTNKPESPAFYGIDNKIWVFVEEARYYNFLTLLITVVFFKMILNSYSGRFHVLVCVFLAAGYFKTLYVKTSGFKSCVFFDCQTMESRLIKTNSTMNNSFFFNKFAIEGSGDSKNSQTKLLGHIFGYNAGHITTQ